MNSVIAKHMIMTPDFRDPFEPSPESTADNSGGYIRDEIFSILKMCHLSGGVVPCVDAQSSRRHRESAGEKRNENAQNILQIMRCVHACTADVDDEREHM